MTLDRWNRLQTGEPVFRQANPSDAPLKNFTNEQHEQWRFDFKMTSSNIICRNLRTHVCSRLSFKIKNYVLYFIINWEHVLCLLIHNFTQFRHIMEMKNFHSYPHLCSVPSLGQVPHNAATWEGWSAREDKATSLHQDVKNISWVERGTKHNLKGEYTDHTLEVMKLKLLPSSENWNYHLI